MNRFYILNELVKQTKKRACNRNYSWLEKLKTFIVWIFIGKICQLLLQGYCLPRIYEATYCIFI